MILNEIRARLFITFRPFYVRKKRILRKGECNNCGDCCGKCEYRKDGKCSLRHVWEKEDYCFRPFPIDEKDRDAVSKRCSYYW